MVVTLLVHRQATGPEGIGDLRYRFAAARIRSASAIWSGASARGRPIAKRGDADKSDDIARLAKVISPG